MYGGVGIGKTHLVQAVGNEIVKNNPNAHVVYVSSEQFVQEFLDAIRYKKNTDFAGYYRSADVLIVDDIQFIAGKEKTQEEFFHTFNALHQANKQIIISGDKPPSDIPTLEDRLRSRFAWGMSIDMQIPDFETRCAIVQTKASQHNVVLDPPVVEFLANLVTTNIRELEGVLNQLLAYCEMRGLSPDIAVTSTLFSNDKKRPKHLSARQVIDKTAKHFQILLEDLVGPKRDKDIVVPRQVAMYILRSELHLSFPKIAHELGRKDHTTAIHSVEKIEKEINTDPHMRQHIIEIKENSMRKTRAQPAGKLLITSAPGGYAKPLGGKPVQLYNLNTQTVRLTFHKQTSRTTAVTTPLIPTFHTPYIKRQKETWLLNTRYVSGELL